MSTAQILKKEIEQAPEPILLETLHFIRFLKSKGVDDTFNGLLLSESALAKDWNTPEEDKAWANL
jgi:hypothetical protein